jgi:hypothetical protein
MPATDSCAPRQMEREHILPGVRCRHEAYGMSLVHSNSVVPMRQRPLKAASEVDLAQTALVFQPVNP